MYPDWVTVVLTLVILVWLVGLSYLFLTDRKFLKDLFPKSGERDIRKRFEEVLESVKGFDIKLSDLDNKLRVLDKNSLGYVQRVEVLRFNPYNDTGGDQSFSVALLDKIGDGVVVTSLHTRSGTRVFAKPVIAGKADKYQLSKEEDQVIKKAMQEV